MGQTFRLSYLCGNRKNNQQIRESLSTKWPLQMDRDMVTLHVDYPRWYFKQTRAIPSQVYCNNGQTRSYISLCWCYRFNKLLDYWMNLLHLSRSFNVYKVISFLFQGSTKSSILGETSVNPARFRDAKAFTQISLPLRKCNHGTVLQVRHLLILSSLMLAL